jgi:hypothetical protein
MHLQDIIGRLVSDPHNWGGFQFCSGPFVQAFSEGKCLLFDEINLASRSVLQCIEGAIDSKQISLEIPGISLVKYRMHPNFRLIATQNPNEGRFKMKRENLTLKLLSKFASVEFPEIQTDELLEIAQSQANCINYFNQDVVKDLVLFHHEWSHREEVLQSCHCFTIREITGSILALKDSQNPYDVIMTFYGMRYPDKIRKLLIGLLQEKYPSLYFQPLAFSIPQKFPRCFQNSSLIRIVKFILTSFENKKNVLLIGKEGSGLTQIARWTAEFYSTIHSSDNTFQKSFCFSCTPETQISDLVAFGDLYFWATQTRIPCFLCFFSQKHDNSLLYSYSMRNYHVFG